MRGKDDERTMGECEKRGKYKHKLDKKKMQLKQHTDKSRIIKLQDNTVKTKAEGRTQEIQLIKRKRRTKLKTQKFNTITIKLQDKTGKTNVKGKHKKP